MSTDTPAPTPEMMHQVAPYPAELATLVHELHFRKHLGWEAWLVDDYQRDKPGRHTGESRGLTLVIQRSGHDTYDPDRIIAVHHYFAVPPSTFNRQSWMWWLFKRLGSVDQHERMEDFVLKRTGDGGEEITERPFVPCHGPGWDPYLITVERTETDRRTRFTGDLSPE